MSNKLLKAFDAQSNKLNQQAEQIAELKAENQRLKEENRVLREKIKGYGYNDSADAGFEQETK